MFRMSKFGYLTTTTLLTLTLLTSCSKEAEPTPTPTPDLVAPTIGNGTTVTPPIVVPTDPEDENLEGEEGSSGENEEDSDVSPEDLEPSDAPATPPEGETPEGSPPVLTSSSFTLDTVGQTYNVTVTGGTDVQNVSYSSDNTAVATVSSTGTVTAIADGSATITVKFTHDGAEETLKAQVRCAIPEETPEPEPTPDPVPEPEPEPEPTPEPEPEPTPAPSGADLTSFYNSMASAHAFGGMEQVTGAFLDNFFPGMSGVSTNQQQIYMAMMSATAVEIALVEVANSSDVATVEGIFRNRISTQVDGGAWYPETIESWNNNSRVVSKGNYVMMIVHPSCDSVVSSFNALF